MLRKHLLASLAASALIAGPALAQTSTAPAQPSTQQQTQPGSMNSTQPMNNRTGTMPGGSSTMQNRDMQSTQAPASGMDRTAGDRSAMDRSAMTPLAAPGAGHMLGSDFEGTRVYGANNENIGEISDTLIDRDGRIVAVVVGVGGFLGIGEKDVAIPFDALEIVADNRAVRSPAATGTVGTTGTTAPGATGTAAPATTAGEREGTINPNRIVLRGMTKQDLENAPEFDADRTADASTVAPRAPATGTAPATAPRAPATGTAPATAPRQ